METMSKPRVLVCGAVLAYAGYAEHTRTILRALKTVEDKIDLYLYPYRWANNSDTYSNEQEVEWFGRLAQKFNPSQLGHFDISIQIGIPSEWKRYAKYNIGVTAGIECNSVPIEWIDQLNSMNKIITISNFSKQGMLNAKTDEKKVVIPIDVVEYPVKEFAQNKLPLPTITTTFNFVHIGQWAPRKNLENMIRWFVEEFKNDEKVGLILKLQSKSNSIPDKYECRRKLFDLLNQYKERKCKVYFYHGDMTDQELHGLLLNGDVYLSAAHGEGWGLSMFEAAYSGIPVVAPDFSGYREYLYADKKDKNGKSKLRPFFQKVNYELKPLQQHHFQPGLLLPGMFWAYPMEGDFKRCMREIYKDYGRFKTQAKDLKEWILAKFSVEEINKKFIQSIFQHFDLSEHVEEVIEVT